MSKWKKLSNDIQMFGLSLLLPIAVMATVGMILGISGAFAQSYMIERLPFLGIPAIKATIIGLRTIAIIIFNNIPLLFAMGVAYGMSKKEKGIAACKLRSLKDGFTSPLRGLQQIDLLSLVGGCHLGRLGIG